MEKKFLTPHLDTDDGTLPAEKNSIYDPIFARKAYGALLRYFGDKGEYEGIHFSSHDTLEQKKGKLKLFFGKVHGLPKEARLDIQQEIVAPKSTTGWKDEDYLDISGIDWDEVH